jgi:flagellar motor switch protein FliG
LQLDQGAIDMTGAERVTPAAPDVPARRLSRPMKAAVIVRLLQSEGIRLSLADLPVELQVGLVRDMAALRTIDRATLRAVVDEFVAELDGLGLAFPGGLDGALAALDGAVGAAAAARLRQEAGLGGLGDPWTRLGELDTEKLVPVMLEESTEVAAVILSKLKVSKAADLLGRLPGERARRITYAVGQTGAVRPETVDRIGRAVLARLEAEAASAFAAEPVARVGAILNSSQAATREAVLDGLAAEDAGFAEEVRKAIFTFANIPVRLDPRDVPRVTREIEPATLVRALAAAEAAGGPEARAAEFVLSNMSQRMAGQLRDEIETAGRIRQAEGEAAMAEVVAAIRTLAEAGDILLQADED